MTSDNPDMDSVKYWPFETPSIENLSKEQILQINFMKLAFEEGFSPCVSHNSTYQISEGTKGARIIYRGPRRWEVLLGNTEFVSIQAFVNGFAESADAALDWMHNEDIKNIASKLQPNLARMPKGMQPLVLNSDIEST